MPSAMPLATTEPATATIRLAGVELTAPIDLVIAAGWTVTGECVADTSSNGFVKRRLIRALSEAGFFPQGMVPAEIGRTLLARCVELGEIEALEGRRDNNRLAVAKLEAEAALNRRRAAELELDARRTA